MIDPIEKSKYVKVIPIASDCAFSYSEAFVVGWGCSSEVKHKYDFHLTNILQEMMVTIIPHHLCTMSFTESYEICARDAFGTGAGVTYVG